MKPLVTTLFLALLISGCDKGGYSSLTNVAMRPGYKEAKLICTQCHALPEPDKHHPAAWPSIVTRMEGHIRANRQIMPDQKQREAILAFLQSSKRY